MEDIRAKKLKIVQAFDEGRISKADALDMAGRLDAKGSPVYISERPVINEQHPALGNVDRALFQNFSVNEQKGLTELQKRTGLTFSFKNGEIVARAPEEDEWRKVDPDNTWFNYSGQGGLGEFTKDVVDVGYHLPAAALETVATVGSGIAGGVATGGWGALPAAMAGGGLAAGVTETGRQALGNLSGFSEGYDGGQIGTSIAFGGLAPVVFGAGATVKGITKQLLKKGMSMDVAEQTAKKIAQAQRSVITRGVGNAGMWATNRLGAWASGYKPQALAKLRERMAGNLLTLNPAAVPKAIVQDLKASMKHKGQQLKDGFGAALEELDVAIDTTKLEQPLWDLLAAYEKKAERIVPGFKQKMKDLGEEAGTSTKLVDEMGQPLAVADEAIEKTAETLNKTEVQEYFYLKKMLEENLEPGKTLKGRVLTDYLDKINNLTEIRKNPDIKASLQTIDKDLQRVSRQVADDLNKGFDQTVNGEAFLNIKNQYEEFLDDKKIVKRYLKDDKAAESSLRNFGSDKQAVRREELLRLQSNYDVPIEEAANDLFLMSEFINPSLQPKYIGGTSGTQRSVPTSIAGGAAGYAAGQATGFSPFISATIGSVLGSTVGSPAAIKNYTKAGNLFRKGVNQTRRLDPLPQAGVNVWEQMMQQEMGR